MERVLEVDLLIVEKVARPSIVPPDEELNNPISPSVVFPSFVAQEDSALQEGGLLERFVVVKVPIAFRLYSVTKALWDVAGAVVPSPIAIWVMETAVSIFEEQICSRTKRRPAVTITL